MSKRPPNHKAKLSDDRTSAELDPKMLNIAAGGHFYERAKSRRNRHREVFATGAGRAVTEEAVPLGLKRKNSGDGVREALARLRAGKDGVGDLVEARVSVEVDGAKKSAAARSSLTSSATNKRLKAGNGIANNRDENKDGTATISEKVSNSRKCDCSDDVIDLTED